jgi:hypothetical protein
MLESALKIIEYLGIYMDHNLIGSHVDAVGTGESQQNHTCKYHKDVPCGSQLCVGSFVCFRKTRFSWCDGKDEDGWKFLYSGM